jgi:hypothetical protein
MLGNVLKNVNELNFLPPKKCNLISKMELKTSFSRFELNLGKQKSTPVTDAFLLKRKDIKT